MLIAPPPGCTADLMLAFLMLAVHLGEGEEFLRWKTEQGEHLLKCTKWSRYSLIFRAVPSTGISCPAHPAACSETAIAVESHTAGGRNDHFSRRKEKGEKYGHIWI